MAILNPTRLSGEIIFLGRVADRDVTLRSVAAGQLDLGFEGVVGETHSGLTRRSCSRVRQQYPRNTEIRNVRQLSILSDEDIAATAIAMCLPHLAPEWLGATLVLRGIPDFTLIPPSSRLVFASGVSLTVDMENDPCQFPAREIDAEYPGRGKTYKSAAKGRRGVTAWVERPGTLTVGETCILHTPPQRLYAHG